MSLISQVLNKKVISLFECEEIGNVSGILVNKKLKCTYIEIVNKDIYYLIKPKDIIEYSNDCIIIKNKTCINLKDNLELNILGQSKMLGLDVYDTTGKLIGKITDTKLERNFQLCQLIMDNDTSINLNQIFNLSENLCIIKSINFKSKLCNLKPTTIPKIKQKMEIKVEVLKEEIKQPTESKINIITPTQIKPQSNFDYSLLIGRKIKQNIKAPNGEVLLRQNNYIKKEDIKTIRIFGKLYEVLKYSE